MLLEAACGAKDCEIEDGKPIDVDDDEPVGLNIVMDNGRAILGDGIDLRSDITLDKLGPECWAPHP